MTPTTSAVRAACDEAAPVPGVPCCWPDCSCAMAEETPFLTVLLANARAEGAAGEREACAMVAATIEEGLPSTTPREYGDGYCDAINHYAAAIRDRAAKEAT